MRASNPWPVLLLVVVAGCASGGTGHSGDLGASGGGDGAGARDSATPALGPDLASAGGDDLAGGDDAAIARSDLAGVDQTQPPDLIVVGKNAGENCNQDGDCASGLCKAVLAGTAQKVCVAKCQKQADCANFFNLFCEAITAGGVDGYCVPRSPAHCASCAKDADCGSLAERCIQGPGDTAPACHVDCALAGAAACPPDYACGPVADGMVMRQLCLPNAKVCLDSPGGYCDRVAIPQLCSRVNMAGTCNGQRACLMPAGRFDKCGAPAPQFKNSCADQDPAGCMESFSPMATSDKNNCGMCGKACAMGQDCCAMACTPLTTAQNCGACGKACAMGQDCCGGACAALNTVDNCGACANKCPGVGAANSDVACADPANKTCSLTCRGEYYDVNANGADGCEVQHESIGHDKGSATSRGNKDDCDLGLISDTFNAHIDSDARVHANPALTAFSGVVGSAPDYWVATGTGGICLNDYKVILTTTGGGGTPCYRCTIITDKIMNSVTVTGSGSQSMSAGSGSYSSNTQIYFVVEKVCNLPVQESVGYTVQYHL